jgi:hypothetical protein
MLRGNDKWTEFLTACTKKFNEANEVGQGKAFVKRMATIYATKIASNLSVQNFVRQYAYVTKDGTREIKFFQFHGGELVPPQPPQCN